MIPLEIITTLGGLILPPVFDFVKKKFIKSEADTPERTLATLATTKPEVIADYTNALANLTKSKVDWYNRDITGGISTWVANIRALIRPIVVIVAMLHITFAITIQAFIGGEFPVPEGIRAFYCAVISEWVGERLILK